MSDNHFYGPGVLTPPSDHHGASPQALSPLSYSEPLFERRPSTVRGDSTGLSLLAAAACNGKDAGKAKGLRKFISLPLPPLIIFEVQS
jgi:hypothetical protein